MTEAAFQAARKIMQRANHMRGMISGAKGGVAKWTTIANDKPTEKTKQALAKAIARLQDWRDKFAALQFPDVDLKEENHRCKECGRKLKVDELCECIYQ